MVRRLFETDGVRGITNTYPMVPEIALKIGKATAYVLAKGKRKPKIIIGKDTRLSGYMFETALTSGLLSMGAEVLLVGPIPSPGVAHLTRSFAADAGIMITASHNPAGHNGIKLFSNEGYKLPDEVEEEIERFVLDSEPEHVDPLEIGKAIRIDDAKGRYIEFLKGCIGNISLKGLKVVLDCANGAAYDITPHILRELGAEVIILNNTPDGTNINKGCGATKPEVIQKAVVKAGADIGVSLDGDADRVILADEKGNIVNGDHILSILALDGIRKKTLPHNTVVATQYSTLALDNLIESAGGHVVRVLNGDRYVIAEMQKHGFMLGGEQTGHIIPGKYITTGDGSLTALLILRILQEQEKPLSELASVLQPYPQVLKNLDVKEKKPLEIMPTVKKTIEKIEKKMGKEGRVLMRYSGTEKKARVMIEGKDQAEIEKYCDDIITEIKKEVGL